MERQLLNVKVNYLWGIMFKTIESKFCKEIMIFRHDVSITMSIGLFFVLSNRLLLLSMFLYARLFV